MITAVRDAVCALLVAARYGHVTLQPAPSQPAPSGAHPLRDASVPRRRRLSFATAGAQAGALRAALLAALSLMFVGTVGRAYASPPSVNLVTAPLVSPVTAFGGGCVNGLPPAGQYGNCTTHTVGVAAWPSGQHAPEITALARTLGWGRYSGTQYAQNVFDYVRNNIAIEFRFGLSKGARGALIDQSGTAFDQANLMVELLRVGGVSADYQVGTINLSAQQFGLWSGFVKNLVQSTQTFDVDAKAACQFLADGGIPAIVNGASDCTNAAVTGNLTSLTMAHIWVSANGLLYDPSFKRQTLKAGVNLASAMGCTSVSPPNCGADANSAAMSGATSANLNGNANFPYIANVNEANLGSKLDGFARSLQTYVQNNNRFAAVEDVVGGKVIDITFAPIPSGTLSYIASVQPAWPAGSDIPDQYRTSFVVQPDSTRSATTAYFADETAGKPILVGYDGSSQTGNTSNLITIVVTVNHPYAANSSTYADDTENLTVINDTDAPANNPTVIVPIWGDAGPGTEKFYGLRNALSNIAPQQSLPAAGARLASQQSGLYRILGGAAATQATVHHTMIVVDDFIEQQVTASQPYFTLQSAVSLNSLTNDSTARSAAFESLAVLGDMAEGSSLQQVQDFWEPFSTTSELVLDNRNHMKLVSVPHTSMSSAFGAGLLTNYATSRQTTLQAMAGLNYDFILAQDGSGQSFTLNSGVAYVPFGPDYGYTATSRSLLLGELFKGGGSGPEGTSDQSPTVSVHQSDYSLKQKRYASVDPASGALNLTPSPDIVTGVGDFPNSLSFQRYYNSNVETWSGWQVATYGLPSPTFRPVYTGPDNDSYTKIGGGWTYNLQITARVINNADLALGETSGLDAVRTIAGIFTLQDVNRVAGLDRRLTSAFTSYWISQGFMANAVNVSMPPRTEVFGKLPDGTYNQPFGSASKLTVSGARSGAYAFSSGTLFDYSGLSINYTGKMGDLLHFRVASSSTNQVNNLSGPTFTADTWTFPDGNVVTFGYTTYLSLAGARLVLNTVSNSLGRTLTFGASFSFDFGGFNYGAIINTVTDENNRGISIGRPGCSTAPYQPFYLTCNTITITLPDTTSVLKYDYTPGGNSPNPAIPIPSQYRLRRWFTPTDTNNPYKTAVYDDYFRVAQVKDNLGHANTYFAGALFDENWKHAEVQDAVNGVTVEQFDRWNDLLNITDPMGRFTTHTYDSAHRLILTTLPDFNSIQLAYDVRSNVLSTTLHAKPSLPAPDIVTSRDFPPACVAGSTCAAGQSPLTDCAPTYLSQTITAKTCNQPVSTIDERTYVTNYTYNGFTGQVLKIQRPADGNNERPETDFGYTTQTGSNLSLLTLKTDWVKVSTAKTQVTSYDYDTFANHYVMLHSTVDPGGKNLRTTFAFDAVGNLKSVDGPRADVNDVTSYTWDSLRRLRLNILADPGTGARPATQFTYDADDLLKQVDRGTADASANFTAAVSTLLAYDIAGRKLRETVLDGTSTSVPALKVTDYTYYDDEELKCSAVRMTPSAWGATPIDACTLTASSPPLDRITYFQRDADREVTSETRGYLSTTPQVYASYAYTPNGKQRTVADGRSNQSTFEYDGFDRLAKLRFPLLGAAGQSSTTDYEKYGYDAAGHMVSKQLRNCKQPSSCANPDQNAPVISYGYDAPGRLIHKGGSGVADVTYTNDLLGHQTSAHFTTSGLGVDYGYDSAGRLQTETTNGRMVTYGYDENSELGQRTSVTWPSGSNDGTALKVTYDFDALGRFSKIRENGATSGVGVLDVFGYDSLGRRSTITRGNSTTTGTSASPISYDNADRVTGFTHAMVASDGVTPRNLTLSFGYNNANQIMTRAESDPGFTWNNYGSAQSFTYNALNHDVSIETQANGYDALGNLTNDGSRTYGYDNENRLLTVVSGATTVSLAYDPLGRLQQTAATTSGVTTTTQFLYAGDMLVSEYDGASGLLQRRYVPGPNVDEPVLWYQGSDLSQRRWLHADNQGTIVGWTDSGGKVTPIAFGPYGEPQTWGGLRYAYTGQIAIPEAQIYYYKARMYDAMRGWFLQTDPVRYRDDYDLYAYVGEDPVNKKDPTGTRVTCSENSCQIDCHSVLECTGDFENVAARYGVRAATNALNSPPTVHQNEGSSSDPSPRPAAEPDKIKTDDTGKVHGTLPDANDIPEDQIESSIGELNNSIEKRKEEIADHPEGDPNGSAKEKRQDRQRRQHEERVRREEELRDELFRRLLGQ